SRWIGQRRDGRILHVAYPFLCRELRRVNNAMKCRPSGPSPTFGYISRGNNPPDYTQLEDFGIGRSLEP
ncbi:MAG: hypothetical protein RLP08_04400, partial [Marinovum algicola]